MLEHAPPEWKKSLSIWWWFSKFRKNDYFSRGKLMYVVKLDAKVKQSNAWILRYLYIKSHSYKKYKDFFFTYSSSSNKIWFEKFFQFRPWSLDCTFSWWRLKWLTSRCWNSWYWTFRWHPGGIQVVSSRWHSAGGILQVSGWYPGGVQLFHKNDSCDDKLDEIVKIIVQSVIIPFPKSNCLNKTVSR